MRTSAPIRTSRAIRAITLDVTQTLIHCPRLGEIYAEVLGRHGIEVAPGDAGRLVRTVWQEMSCSADPARDRFRSHPDGEAGWWRAFLERFCALLGSPPPSRFAAAELFHRFGKAEAWEVFPDVPGTLVRLERMGLELAVISNWDHRLPALLDDLNLASHFRAIVFSGEVGVEKPHPDIFAAALAELGMSAEEVLHVGDSRIDDLEGAEAAGLHARQLLRSFPRRGSLERSAIKSLGDLPRLLAAG